MSVSVDDFKNALGALPAGVAVLTSADDQDQLVGATVSAFMSLSLDPPLVLAALGLNTRTAQAIRQRRAFGAHIIGAGQEVLAFRFASLTAEKFEGLAFSLNGAGVPLLEDCPIRMECSLFAEYPGGDHAIFVGHIDSIALDPDRPAPLAWHGRGFRRLSDLTGDEVHTPEVYGQFSSWLVHLRQEP